jgi:hypothetical protein
MIIDSLLEFARNQDLTATAVSTNSVDFGAKRDVGPGEPLFLVVVSKAAPGGTTPTMTISIEVDDASNFPSAATIFTGPTLSAAQFPAGKIEVIPWPQSRNERHARVRFTCGGTTPTFTVDAFLTNQPPTTWQAYPDAL